MTISADSLRIGGSYPQTPNKRVQPIQDQPQGKAQQEPQAGTVKAIKDQATLEGAQQYQQKTVYDKPAGVAGQALESYTSLSKEDKKAQLRQLMGVDIYA